MKIKNYYRIMLAMGVLTWGFVPSMQAQEATILTITETDEDGDRWTIGDSHRFIDLNSRIIIRLDKDSLLTLVETNEALARKLNNVQRLNLLAGKGEQALLSVVEAYNTWLTTGRKSSYENTIGNVARITLEMIEILDESDMSEVHSRFDEVLNEKISAIKQYRSFFEIINDEYIRITQEIEDIINEQGTYFSMGGWLIHEGESRPVHLPRFDEYPEQEFYRADRFREVIVNISGAHEDMLRQFENRDRSVPLSDVTGELISTFRAEAYSLEDEMRTCLDSLKDETESVFNKYADKLSGLKSDYDALENQFEQFINQLQTRIGRITAGSNSQELNEVILSISPLVIATENLHAKFTAFADSVEIRLSNLLDPPVNRYKEVLDDCSERISKVLVLSDLEDSFRAISSVNTSELRLGEKVLQHSPDRLPASTSFSLNRTGYREPGDLIVIRLVSGRAGERPADLEVRQLRMELVLTYLKLAPGLLYARPQTNSDKGVSGSFHVAPSYSVLLKWGSRKNSFHNRLFQPGIGLNISALDFNKDNTPELGIALVGSVFMDYIQIGYGYNLNVEESFFSLGLRLPLASMTLATDPN